MRRGQNALRVHRRIARARECIPSASATWGHIAPLHSGHCGVGVMRTAGSRARVYAGTCANENRFALGMICAGASTSAMQFTSVDSSEARQTAAQIISLPCAGIKCIPLGAGRGQRRPRTRSDGLDTFTELLQTYAKFGQFFSCLCFVIV